MIRIFLIFFVLQISLGIHKASAANHKENLPFIEIKGKHSAILIPSTHSFLEIDIDISNIPMKRDDYLYLEYDVLSFSSADINPMAPPLYRPSKADLLEREKALEDALRALMARLGRPSIDISALIELHPYVLLSLLDQKCIELGGKKNHAGGIDTLIRQQALLMGLNIRSLESLRESLTPVANLSGNELIPLIKTISSRIVNDTCSVVGIGYAEGLTEMILAGDLGGVFFATQEFHEKYYGSTVLNDAYLGSMRNREMVRRIVQALEIATNDASPIFVIGAAHFYGEMGVVRLLCGNGFSLIQKGLRKPDVDLCEPSPGESALRKL
jgi:uncharacterized protein YbaP (TraB family)